MLAMTDLQSHLNRIKSAELEYASETFPASLFAIMVLFIA